MGVLVCCKYLYSDGSREFISGCFLRISSQTRHSRVLREYLTDALDKQLSRFISLTST